MRSTACWSWDARSPSASPEPQPGLGHLRLHPWSMQHGCTEPRLHKRGQPPGSGLGKRRWPVERANAWLLENKRLGLRYDRLGFIVEALLQAACIFLVAPRLAREF